MSRRQRETLQVFESLSPGDRVQLTHEVKVGFRDWETITEGTVIECARRRHGLHYQRNFDDRAFSDMIVLQLDDGELTTVTLDEFSILKKLPSAEPDAREDASSGDTSAR